MQQEIKDYVTALASFLVKNKKKMSYKDLIQHLRFNDILEYKEPIGIGQGIASLYRGLIKEGKEKEAGNVALAFCGHNKKYAWDKDDPKMSLYQKQEGICAGCNKFFVPGNLSVDHIVPKAKGGSEDSKNLQLLCRSCNSIKGDRTMDYLKEQLTAKGYNK